MKQRNLSLTFIATALCMCLINATPALSRQDEKISVPLTINEEFQQQVRFFLDFGADTQDYSFPADKHAAVAQAQGGVLVRAERVKEQQPAYRIWVDLNGDRSLTNEAAQVVTPNSSVVVKVIRRWPDGKEKALPYSISYSRDADRSGQVRDYFSWSPHYRAEGKLKINNCEALFTVLDINGDGLFDKADFAKGTSIGLDIDGDGRIWGRGEYLKGEQIIEYCGEALLIERLEADGTFLALAKTTLRVPKVGEPLPAFSLTTLDGKAIRSEELKGKVHLIDFWASWCQPCVEKFALVKQLGNEYKDALTIIAVNVDEGSRAAMAHRVIKDYRLPWLHVMKGQGESDPLWKMFGGMEGNRLAIPLYILVDDKGMLRYAGEGGKDLSELRAGIKELLVGKQAKVKGQ